MSATPPAPHEHGRAPFLRLLAEGVALLTACLAGAVALSWPLAPRMGEVLTSGHSDGDLGNTVAAQRYLAQVLSGAASAEAWDKQFYPDGLDLIEQSWNLLALATTAWPHWFLDAVPAWNLGIIVLMALNATAFGLVGRSLGGRPGALLAASATLSFGFAWDELFEGHLEQAYLLPTALALYGAAGVHRGRPRGWLWLGLGMGLCGATYWFAPPLLAVGLLGFFGSRLLDRSTLSQLGAAALLSVLVALPFTLRVFGALTSDTLGETLLQDEHIRFMRVENSASALAALAWPLAGHSDQALPLSAVLLLLGGALVLPRARPWLAAGLVGVVFSMGPVLQSQDGPVTLGGHSVPLPFALLDIFPPMRRLWWPQRFLAAAAPFVILGLATLPGLLSQGRPSSLARRALLPASLALSLLICWEGRWVVGKAAAQPSHSIRATAYDPAPDGFYYESPVPSWRPPEGTTAPLLHFPLEHTQDIVALHMLEHGQPLIGGNGIQEAHSRPPAFAARLEASPFLRSWVNPDVPVRLDPAALRELQALEVRWLLWYLPDPERFPEAHRRQREDSARLTELVGAPAEELPTLLVWDLERSARGPSASAEQPRPPYQEPPGPP